LETFVTLAPWQTDVSEKKTLPTLQWLNDHHFPVQIAMWDISPLFDKPKLALSFQLLERQWA